VHVLITLSEFFVKLIRWNPNFKLVQALQSSRVGAYLIDCETLKPWFDEVGCDGGDGVAEFGRVQSALDWKLLQEEG